MPNAARLAIALCLVLATRAAAEDSCPRCGVALSVAHHGPMPRAVQGVSMTNFQFTAMDATIGVNDTVTWTNNAPAGTFHTTTSDTGLWDSGSIGSGSNFSRTFVAAGTFPYHCSIHGSPGAGMHGTIVVVTTPTITSSSTTHGTVNSPLTFDVIADQSPTSYAATGLPPGLTIDLTTGVISGTPTSSAGSPFAANITATNAAGTGNATLTFTIDPLVAGAPSITSSTAVTGNVSGSFSYPITATNSPNSYSASVLPAGLVLDPTSGLINGTPTTTGQFQVQITATNGSGTATTTLTITISPATGGSSTTATAGTGTSGYSATGGGSCGAGGGTTALLLVMLVGVAGRRRLIGGAR